MGCLKRHGLTFMETECIYMKGVIASSSLSEKCMLCTLQRGLKTYALKDNTCYSTVDAHMLYQYVVKEDLCNGSTFGPFGNFEVYEIGPKEKLESKLAKGKLSFSFTMRN